MYSIELGLTTHLKFTHDEWLKLQILVCLSFDKKVGGVIKPLLQVLLQGHNSIPLSVCLIFRNINTADFYSNVYQLSNDGAVRSIVNCIYS